MDSGQWLTGYSKQWVLGQYGCCGHGSCRLHQCPWVASDISFEAGTAPATQVLNGRERETCPGCTGGCTNAEAVGVEMERVVACAGQESSQVLEKGSTAEGSSVVEVEQRHLSSVAVMLAAVKVQFKGVNRTEAVSSCSNCYGISLGCLICLGALEAIVQVSVVQGDIVECRMHGWGKFGVVGNGQFANT